MGRLLLSAGIFKPVCGVTKSISFGGEKVSHEKDPTDPKEQDEKWQFENDQKGPLNKTEWNVIDPEKPLCSQNLNGALGPWGRAMPTCCKY